MKTLVLFDDKYAVEISPERAPEGIAIPCGDSLNVFVDMGDGKKSLLFEAEQRQFSTVGICPVRIGASPDDHIRLLDSAADLAILGDTLSVMDPADAYLNGKKLYAGDYPIRCGDMIWAGTTRLTLHDGHIGCAGTRYVSRLNITVAIPEPYAEFPIYKRSPRIIKRMSDETVELAEPQAKETRGKGELAKLIIPPLATSAVMVGGSLLMGRGIFVIISAAAMLVSLVFSITTYLSDRKSRFLQEAERDEAYDRYLLAKRKHIHGLYEAQRESLLYHNPPPGEIVAEILSNSSRVYERSANDSDFLTLSLGHGTVPVSFNLKYKADAETGKPDPLAEEMRAIGARYQSISDMPMVIDLKAAHLGLVGEKASIHRVLASILIQLCFFQSYHDIEVIVLTEESDRPLFEWSRWYPHCRVKSINVTGLVSAENQRDQVLGNISQVLKMRHQKQAEEKKDTRFLPHYVFVIDNPKLIINHSIMEYLQTSDTSLGFSIVHATHIQSNLPEYIKTVFLLTGGGHGTLLMDKGVFINRPVILPDMTGLELETVARKLAPLRHMQGVSTQIPEMVSFFELYAVKRPEEIPVLALWQENACHKSMAVPLGLRGKADIVTLNLHEKAHGPHGLVAGTTGSGKSEIVQSYILSLAVNFHPCEVGFLLIDYKGGGMANLFADLPHLLGTITNLDGGESMRALVSIKSELRRRQRIFGEAGVNSINQYTKLFRAGETVTPLPHLFIISDEFAELKKEQPDFMSELVSTARIGRSLGVHLILATQKPTGVVDDQIWSNSRFRLALKVANEGDSNEILKTPDAARITQAGRAYLQVGNNEVYELFQSAWSGMPFLEDVVERGFDSRVYLINQLGQGVLLNEDLSAVDRSDESKLTQLDVTVNHISDLYRSLDAIPVERPWLPPLAEHIVTPAIKPGEDVGKIEGHHMAVPLAVVDIPEEQRQTEYIHDFNDDGNLAVFAASGFGKSSLLMTAALTLAAQNSPRLVNLFVLDYGNSALAQLRGLPHTADYLGVDDEEKLDKLIKLFTEELKRRKRLYALANAANFRMYNEAGEEKLAAMILFIDNYDVIREVSVVLDEFLLKLTRDGTGVGIYTVISASRTGAVRYAVLNNFKNKIALFMSDKTDIASVVGRSPYDLPEVRGRAMVRLADVHTAQCYLPALHGSATIIADISEKNTAPKASGVRVLAETITCADLEPYAGTWERGAILGFDPVNTEPVFLDISVPNHLIVGTPLTGKTNLLKLLITQLPDIRVFVADSRAGDLADYAEMPHVCYMGKESEWAGFYDGLADEVAERDRAFACSGLRMKEFALSQTPLLFLIDDADNFIELTKGKAADAEALIDRAMEMGITIVCTTLPNKMRGYDNITKLLKEAPSGVVLGNPADQGVWSVQIPRGYKVAKDAGFYIRHGETRQVKMPFAG